VTSRSALPSVDRVLRDPGTGDLVSRFGRSATTGAVREVLADLRAMPVSTEVEIAGIVGRVRTRLDQAARPSIGPVFNLTGTVLHTNLGRASLPAVAVEAMREAASGPVTLEMDLDRGARGDRDTHVAGLLQQFTGAEAATVVNNNAAAVLLVLNTLALRREVVVARSELVEIGGSFRMPDICARAGGRLREVGTTNRVHRRDYEEAIGPKTGLVLKAHRSNFAIVGFTSEVAERDLARLCRDRGVPLVVDLGSGALVGLERWSLPHEPTAAESIAAGACLVTFSGDKLLGGPQAGLIVGRADLIERVRRNPLKRALRLDKVTLAGLAAVLRLYRDPDRLPDRLPTLGQLTRPVADIRAAAERLQPPVASAVGGAATVSVVACESQIGSGAQPTSTLPSAGLAVVPVVEKRRAGAELERLSAAFRALPIPVLGRIQDGAFLLDLRCLDDEDRFVAQLGEMTIRER